MLRLPPFRDILDGMIRDEACFPPDIFDAARLRGLFDEHMSGRHSHMRMLLCLMTFGRWFSKFGPGR